MLKKRIIPCLDIKDGRTVKGINFEALRDAGHPLELAEHYAAEGADELVFLDITATLEQRKTLVTLVSDIAKCIQIPFTVGGGINSVEDARAIIKAGADKVSINSAALKRPQLIRELADEFGSQCVVLAIDARYAEGAWMVYSHGGKIATGWQVMDWAKAGERLGAGELLLTSVNHDGTGEGFAIGLTRAVAGEVNIPVIASGGAGEPAHFEDLFLNTRATGALAAGMFHNKVISIPALKHFLNSKEIPIRK